MHVPGRVQLLLKRICIIFAVSFLACFFYRVKGIKVADPELQRRGYTRLFHEPRTRQDEAGLTIQSFIVQPESEGGLGVISHWRYMVGFLLILLISVSGKVLKSFVELEPPAGWKYLSKFTTDVGTGQWSLKVKLARGPKSFTGRKFPLNFTTYTDTEWERSQYQVACPSLPTAHTSVIDLPADGSWSDPLEGSLILRSKPALWYFILSDCGNTLGEYAKIRFEITILNTDGSHYSQEQQGMIPLLCCLIAVFLLLLGNNLLSLYRHYNIQEELDCSLILLNFAACCTLAGLIFGLGDLWFYAENGKGVPAFTFFQQFSEITSQILISFVLIALAEGYGLKTKEFPSPESYIPLFLMIAMAHVVVIGLGLLADETRCKYSMYEGWEGEGLMLLRGGLFAWFMYNLNNSFGGKDSPQMMDYVGKFKKVGSAFFLSLPCVILISYLFPEYQRPGITFGCSIFLEIASQVLLTLLFTGRGRFHQLSTYSDSVLPGGKLHY